MQAVTKEMVALNCSDKDEVIIAVMGATGLVSSLASLLAIVLVARRKLHRRLVYRLGAYLASAGLLNSVTAALQLVMLFSDTAHLCDTLGFLSLYTLWVNIFFTAWMTFHLFCYAVFFKNMKGMEAVYVVVSLVAPSVAAAVPLTTSSYGMDSICWIMFAVPAQNGSTCTVSETGIVEEFALWVGPGFVLLLLESTALVAMVTILACRVCKKGGGGGGGEGGVIIKPQRTALVQLLPLAIYPIALCLLVIPIIAFRIHYARHAPSKLPRSLFLASVASYASIGLVVSGALVAHICMFAKGYPASRRPINVAPPYNALIYQS